MGFFDKLKMRTKGASLVVLDPVINLEDLQRVTNPRYRDYCVEHYPYAGFYYSRCKDGRYLWNRYSTGIIELDEFQFATGYRTEKEAWALIDIAIEQFTRDTVRTITR